jgi:fluoride exporter
LTSLPDGIQLFAVAIGGAIGSMARFAAGYYMSGAFGTTFPWSTLLVNVSGGFFIGFVATLAFAKPGTVDPLIRLLLTTGFAGGFTTFSAFSFETWSLFERGDIALAAMNVAGNLILSIAGVVLGALLARLL